jgi:hypothetical protein
MAYRKPFTPEQRREAIRAYRSYLKHSSILRKEYQPSNRNQRELLREYRIAIGEMADELRKTDRAVDTLALTRSDAYAKWVAMEYWRLQRLEG